MRARWAALVLALLDTAAWLLIAGTMLLSASEPATRALDQFAALVVSVLYFVSGAPALLLAWKSRAPRVALALALVFPAAIAALLIATVVMLP
jgi:hypothetical protein